MTYPADERAKIASSAGVDPIAFAAQEITDLIDAHAKTAAFCARNGYAPIVDTSLPVVSLRIVNLMIGIGWQAPGGLEIPDDPAEVTE
jgi:hypothetical protein